MSKTMAKKALHRMAIQLRSIAAGEFIVKNHRNKVCRK